MVQGLNATNPTAYLQQLAAGNNINTVGNNQQANGLTRTTETTGTATNADKTVKQLEEEIDKLQSEKGLNYKKMEKIQAEIEEQVKKIRGKYLKIYA